MEAKRPEPLTRLVDFCPQIVTGEADILPAQRRYLGEQFVVHVDAAAA